MNIPWWGYVILAGLAWGTYVPIIFYGGTELTTRPGTVGGRLASILCVGIAYFVMAVLIPLVMMGGAVVIVAINVVAGVLKTNARERSRREIAAYIAEGSMTPEQGERLMRAGKGGDKA